MYFQTLSPFTLRIVNVEYGALYTYYRFIKDQKPYFMYKIVPSKNLINKIKRIKIEILG